MELTKGCRYSEDEEYLIIDSMIGMGQLPLENLSSLERSSLEIDTIINEHVQIAGNTSDWLVAYIFDS